MDGGAWKAAVREVTKSRTRLSDFTFTFHFHALEKEMATHSSVLAWRIPGTGEPGGLPSVGSHRVGHDWSDLAAAAACTNVEAHKYIKQMLTAGPRSLPTYGPPHFSVWCLEPRTFWILDTPPPIPPSAGVYILSPGAHTCLSPG